MTAHQQSLTHKYIKGETLLRAKPIALAKGEFEIWRGAKMIARVRTRAQEPPVLFWGQCQLESALDAIFIHQLESAQKAREKAEIRKVAAGEAALVALVPRPVLVPQVIITLAPDGSLQAELPASGATRRVVKFKSGEAERSIKAILEEQRSGNIAIGQGGAPTRQQVWHQENHQDFPDSRCAHCIAEGRIKPQAKRQRRSELITKSKDVEVRRLVAVQKRKRGEVLKVSTNKLNAEDLGL